MKEFDNIFKNRLRKYGSDVPDSLWEKIEQKNRKKRRSFFWFWFLGGALIVSATIAWFTLPINFNKNTSLKTEKIQLENKKEEESIITENSISQINKEIVSKNKTINLIEKNSRLNELIQPALTSDYIPTEYTKEGTVLENQKTTETVNNIKSYDFTELKKERLLLEKHASLKKTPSLLIPVKSIYTKNTILELNPALGEENIKKKRDHSVYLDLLAGASIHQQILEAKNSENEFYRSLREDSETGRISYTGSIRISKKLKNGLLLSTGLTYTLINDRFDWSKEPTTQLIFRNDSLVGSQTGLRVKKTYNRFHFIEAPLLIGYEMEMKKMGLSFSVGPMINLWFKSRGDFLTLDSRPVRFTNTADKSYPGFRSWGGVSLFANSSFSFAIQPRTKILVEPFLRYQLSDLTMDNYPLKQRYFNGGVALGIRQIF